MPKEPLRPRGIIDELTSKDCTYLSTKNSVSRELVQTLGKHADIVVVDEHSMLPSYDILINSIPHDLKSPIWPEAFRGSGKSCMMNVYLKYDLHKRFNIDFEPTKTASECQHGGHPTEKNPNHMRFQNQPTKARRRK